MTQMYLYIYTCMYTHTTGPPPQNCDDFVLAFPRGFRFKITKNRYSYVCPYFAQSTIRIKM